MTNAPKPWTLEIETAGCEFHLMATSTADGNKWFRSNAQTLRGAKAMLTRCAKEDGLTKSKDGMRAE